MAKEDAKQPYVLLSTYDKLYQDRYQVKPKFNRYKEKWAMQDVIESIGFDRAIELLQYYFKIDKPGHALPWFLYNFDRLDEILCQVTEDKIRREKIMLATKKMVEENSEH
ncbi:hypothetical protein UFOVP1491_114 [uncultured Caudovirales phage]|jgi:hypothetical protein|uniref:Uncharacterized protein n=1 Tax=uncultured Caudovirales phage TaxID=2100421 RepID=A0A6J5MYL4_9CAUD|nr:hypothetical protein UFOVP485_7 [uncultured Caudovirales phage]CAB4151037.1 hypothetical protein UFOVP575_111 [uncultured Caudovirales phage]CAB4174441.1 hypothetical protein UFOVP963_49 [uncultured Caudovirales phage]CAB4179818.1 hypothetical protein UFOVP1032_114 [uncultured Caudovirales phage]CAB4185391.1 hypothetical protein UFOVP1125_30 [uncultured Caudovirales phage]